MRGFSFKEIEGRYGMDDNVAHRHWHQHMGAPTLIADYSEPPKIQISVEEIVAEWWSSLMRMKDDAAALRDLKQYQPAGKMERGLSSGLMRAMSEVSAKVERDKLATQLENLETKIQTRDAKQIDQNSIPISDRKPLELEPIIDPLN